MILEPKNIADTQQVVDSQQIFLGLLTFVGQVLNHWQVVLLIAHEMSWSERKNTTFASDE